MNKQKQEFEKDLAALLSRYSLDNALCTPDFILVEFITNQLATFDMINRRRSKWLLEEKQMSEEDATS